MPLRPRGGSKRDGGAASLRASVTFRIISNYSGIMLHITIPGTTGLLPGTLQDTCKQSQGSNLVFLKGKEIQTVKKIIWLIPSSDNLIIT